MDYDQFWKRCKTCATDEFDRPKNEGNVSAEGQREQQVQQDPLLQQNQSFEQKQDLRQGQPERDVSEHENTDDFTEVFDYDELPETEDRDGLIDSDIYDSSCKIDLYGESCCPEENEDFAYDDEEYFDDESSEDEGNSDDFEAYDKVSLFDDDDYETSGRTVDKTVAKCDCPKEDSSVTFGLSQNFLHVENSAEQVHENVSQDRSDDCGQLYDSTETMHESVSEDSTFGDIEPEEKEKKVYDFKNGFELPFIQEIFKFIPTFSALGTYIKNISIDEAEEFVQFIEKIKIAWLEDGIDKMFNINGADLTVAVLTDNGDPMTEVRRKISVGAQMVANDKEKWYFLQLFFNSDGTLKRVQFDDISKDKYSDGEWRIVRKNGEKIWLANKDK